MGWWLRIKKINVMVISWKIQFLGEGSRRKNISGRIALKWGRASIVCRSKKGFDEEKGFGVFEGVDTPMHAMVDCLPRSYLCNPLKFYLLY